MKQKAGAQDSGLFRASAGGLFIGSHTVPRKRSSPSCSREKGVGELYGKACFPNLRRVRRGNAGGLRSNVVNDVEVTVGAVIISQTQIGTDCLRIGSVHLNETRKGQEPAEGIVSLQTREHDREIS